MEQVQLAGLLSILDNVQPLSGQSFVSVELDAISGAVCWKAATSPDIGLSLTNGQQNRQL